MTWNAVVSTIGNIETGLGEAQANENAPFTSSIPVYNTAGQLIADAATPLYGGSLINPILYDQNGDAFSTPVWTGSNADGTSEWPLGGQDQDGEPNIGVSGNSTGQWIHDGADGQEFPLPLYALSSPITVVPELTTLTLLGSALLGLGVVYLRRHGAKV